MDVQGSCEIPGRKSRKAANDPKHQALRAGDAELRLHAARRPIEAVIDCPHQPHEIEDGPERPVGGDVRDRFVRSCLGEAGQDCTLRS